jgi:hypothetical protein
VADDTDGGFETDRGSSVKLRGYAPLIAAMPVLDQAFSSKESTWTTQLEQGSRADTAFKAVLDQNRTAYGLKLSRANLRDLAAADLDQYIVATIIWGYPGGMRGGYAADIFSEEEFGPLSATLKAVRSIDIRPNMWEAHLASAKVRGLGLSTYTKLLSFLPFKVGGHDALILDDRIVTVFLSGRFEEFSDLAGSRKEKGDPATWYPDYLAAMDEQCEKLKRDSHRDVTPEKLEMFLFTFGLTLKPEDPNGSH